MTPIASHHRRRIARARPRRAGSLMLEVILAFPLLLIGLLAVVEFGLLLAHLKHVDQAAAVACRAASQLPVSDFAGGQALEAVGQNATGVLAAAGLTAACRIDLEHNLPGGGDAAQSAGICDRPAPAADGLPAAGELSAVRVTVWVELSTLTPDLLATFGYSLAGRVTAAQVTLPHLGE